jgi:hypothetical protein
MNEDLDARYLTRAEIVEMIHGILALSDVVFEQDNLKDEFDILMIKGASKLDECKERGKDER